MVAWLSVVVCLAAAHGLAQGGGRGAAQTSPVLAQLALTEAAARTFVFEEMRNPTTTRHAGVVSRGRAGFLKLPVAARGPAATALFAWAKTYVNTPAFKTAYDTHRKGLAGVAREYDLTVDEEVKKEIADQLASVEQTKQVAASVPPADRAGLLAAIKQTETQLRSPEFAAMLRQQKQEERDRDQAQVGALVKERDAKYPADIQKFFAIRLRDFLAATADVNFAAKTINLTGGTEGIEFLSADDRKRPWQWQEAVIVGREATLAARTAAEAWLKEIER